MSKSTFGWRQAGFTAVATALVFGGTLVGAGAASAAPDPIIAGTYMATSTPKAPDVVAGQAGQDAGDVSLVIKGNFSAGQTLTFALPTNASCSTAAGVNAATSFDGVPTVKVSGALKEDGTGAGTATAPVFNTPVLTSAGAQCSSQGINDTLTVKIQSGSTTPSTSDMFKVSVSGIKYKVGSTVGTGAVPLTATNSDGTATIPTPDPVVNATVTNKFITLVPIVVSSTDSTNSTLGNVTLKETTAGAIFSKTTTGTETLTLDNGTTFTPGVTPTITGAPAGFTVTANKTTGTIDTYTFTTKWQTTPTAVTPTAVTLVVSGLQADTSDVAAGIVSVLTITNDDTTSVDKDAIKVVDYTTMRAGGNDRYLTNIKSYEAFLNNTNGLRTVNVGTVVLAGGGNFPDALSANYFAGTINAGVLLTSPNKLSADVEDIITNGEVKKVYIVGGPAAVSTAVENQIKDLKVAGSFINPNISVTRLAKAGGDRYDTNLAVNTRNPGNTNTVMIAAGTAFNDAQALGPIAYRNGYPLVLTDGGSTLNSQAQAQINQFEPSNVIIAGGTGVVPASIDAALKAQDIHVTRIDANAANGLVTSTAVATWATTKLAGDNQFKSTRANITNQVGYADALSAGPLAGNEGSVILPAANSIELGSSLAAYLGTKSVALRDAVTPPVNVRVTAFRALGQTAVTSRSLLKAAAGALSAR